MTPTDSPLPLLVLSDIHGNLSALQAVLERWPPGSAVLVFLGDLTGYYGNTDDCWNLLLPFHPYAILGNHDMEMRHCLTEGCATPRHVSYKLRYGPSIDDALPTLSPETRAFFLQAPSVLEFEYFGLRFSCFHGSPTNPLEGRVYPDSLELGPLSQTKADYLLLGHTHHRLLHAEGPCTVLNPGSVGQSRRQGGLAEFALIDPENRRASLQALPYDIQPAWQYAENRMGKEAYACKVLTR